MQYNAQHDLGDVLHRDVIPLLFAFAEENKIFAPGGEAAEAIGPIPVVRIVEPIGKGGPNRGKWALESAAKHDLACDMHDPMKAARFGARRFRKGFVRILVDRVGTDVDHVVDWPAPEGRGDRFPHPEIFHQHWNILHWRAGGREYQNVVRLEFSRQACGRVRRKQIDRRPAEGQDVDSLGLEPSCGRTANETAGAEDDYSNWLLSAGMLLLNHC
jgi:hypothetical protein